MEMLPRVAFSNKSERKRMKMYGTDTVQKHRDLTKFNIRFNEVNPPIIDLTKRIYEVRIFNEVNPRSDSI